MPATSENKKKIEALIDKAKATLPKKIDCGSNTTRGSQSEISAPDIYKEVKIGGQFNLAFTYMVTVAL